VNSLVQRLLRFDDSILQSLKGIGSKEFIVIIGPEEKLPWVEGLIYLGHDRETPGILLPTMRKPVTDSHLVAEALAEKRIKKPAFLVDAPPCCGSIAAAQPISRKHLRQLTGTGK
ncbi:MAG: hypothetical protein GY757_19530, partial [bacterium]|nr:hypothetical protein [bacterium]